MLTFTGAMKRIVNAFVRERNRRMSRYGLTSAQVDVLILLLRAPADREIYPGTVQQELKLSCPTVNGLLNRLEQKGFIRFERTLSDRRRKKIVLTEKGRETDLILSPLGMEWERQVTERFSDAELLVLGQLMRKLEVNVERMAMRPKPVAAETRAATSARGDLRFSAGDPPDGRGNNPEPEYGNSECSEPVDPRPCCGCAPEDMGNE